MMKEEKFIGGRKTKGGEYNQFARNFFFVKDVYKETRTMVNESLIPWKKKTVEFNELLLRTSIRQISNGLDFPRSGTPFIEVKF